MTAVSRLLWLLGPSGVGKSTVGWLLHQRCGRGTAYVDTDQLGLCYPAPADDPGNHRIKSTNLAALRFPAGTLIVSGGVETADVMRLYLDKLTEPCVTLCRLRVGSDDLRARIAHRGGPLAQYAEEAVAESVALEEADFADVTVDTNGLAAPDVVELVFTKVDLTA